MSRTSVEEGDGEHHHLGREEEVEGALQRSQRSGVGGGDRRLPRTARLVIAVLGRAAEQAEDQHACGSQRRPTSADQLCRVSCYAARHIVVQALSQCLNRAGC